MRGFDNLTFVYVNYLCVYVEKNAECDVNSTAKLYINCVHNCGNLV